MFQEKLAFLHGLYQRLLAGRVLMSKQEKPFNQLSWGELTEMVYEQVANTVEALQRAEDKVIIIIIIVVKKKLIIITFF